MSELFLQIQNELRRYKTSGFDLSHPQGVMIGKKLYPALHKTINIDNVEGIRTKPFHYPSFQIPHESGNRTQVVGTAFGGAEDAGPTHLIMGLIHPETRYGYANKHDFSLAHDEVSLTHHEVFKKEHRDNVQEAKWTWTSVNNNNYNEKHNPESTNPSTMHDLPFITTQESPNHDSIHKQIEEHAKEPHHSRIFRYEPKGAQTLQYNMDSYDLQQHSKQSFRNNHMPHFISINVKDRSNIDLPLTQGSGSNHLTTHLYNIKTEELKPFKDDGDAIEEFPGY